MCTLVQSFPTSCSVRRIGFPTASTRSAAMALIFSRSTAMASTRSCQFVVVGARKRFQRRASTEPCPREVDACDKGVSAVALAETGLVSASNRASVASVSSPDLKAANRRSPCAGAQQ